MSNTDIQYHTLIGYNYYFIARLWLFLYLILWQADTNDDNSKE